MQNPEELLKKIKDSYKSYYRTAFHLNDKYRDVEEKQLELFNEKNNLITKDPEIELLPEYKKTNISFSHN